MERNVKPRQALLSADRQFSHTITAQVVSLENQVAIMACYMKVPVGQQVYVRLNGNERLYTGVVVPVDNIREILAESSSRQLARCQGFGVKLI